MRTTLFAAALVLASATAAQAEPAGRTWSPDPAWSADRTFCTEAQSADGARVRTVEYASPSGVSRVDEPSDATWRVMGCHKGPHAQQVAETRAKPVEPVLTQVSDRR